jgi:hypothetical protein
MATKKARRGKKAAARKAAPRKEPKSKRHYEGPREWLFPMLEETYTRLRPKEEAEAEPMPPARTSPATKSGCTLYQQLSGRQRRVRACSTAALPLGG